jgi:hypothetical protein
LAEADELGLNLRGVTEELTVDGVRQFESSLEALLAAIAEKHKNFRKDR